MSTAARSSRMPKSVTLSTHREVTTQLDDLRLPCTASAELCKYSMPCKGTGHLQSPAKNRRGYKWRHGCPDWTPQGRAVATARAARLFMAPGLRERGREKAIYSSTSYLFQASTGHCVLLELFTFHGRAFHGICSFVRWSFPCACFLCFRRCIK